MPGDQASRLLVGQRGQRQRERVRLAPTPVRASHEELRPRGTENEQRHAGRPLDETVDEIEEAVVRPVQILEHEHRRPLLAHRLEEATPGGERLAAALAAPTGVRPEAHEWPQVTDDPFRLGRILDEHGNRIRELPGRLVRRVALENAACAFVISPNAQKLIPSP